MFRFPRFFRSFSRSSLLYAPSPDPTPRLINSIENFLQLVPSVERTTGFIKKKLRRWNELEKASPNVMKITRPAMLERTLAILTNASRYQEASIVYATIKAEGFIPSTMADLRLSALGLLNIPQDQHSSIKAEICDFFRSPSFEEDEMLEYVSFLKHIRMSPKTVVSILSMFLQTKREGNNNDYVPSPRVISLLVGLQTQAGMMDQAMEVLLEYDVSSDSDSGTRDSPYGSILSNLSPLDSTSVDRVLALMQKKNVAADTDLFNILLEKAAAVCHASISNRSLGRGDIERGFYHVGFGGDLGLGRDNGVSALWETFVLMVEMEVPPSSLTFAILWRARMLTRGKGWRYSPQKMYQQTIRLLFPQLADSSLRPLHPNKTTDIRCILHSALTLLLTNTSTFPEAIVVLKSFKILGVPLNLETYRLVLRRFDTLMRSSVFGLNNTNTFDNPWARRFLSLTKPQARVTLKEDVKKEFVVKRLLSLDSGLGPADWVTMLANPLPPPPELPSRSRTRRKQQSAHIPPLRLLDITTPLKVLRPKNNEISEAYDETPLTRILRRGIAVSVEIEWARRRQMGGQAVDSSTVVRLVSAAIKRAKEDMLPHG